MRHLVQLALLFAFVLPSLSVHSHRTARAGSSSTCDLSCARADCCTGDREWDASLGQCVRVSCVLTYVGSRNFFNSSSCECEPVVACPLDRAADGTLNYYDSINNRCLRTVIPTAQAETGTLDQNLGRIDLLSNETIAATNTLIECNHGNKTGAGSCECHPGWISNPQQNTLLPLLFEWCNVEEILPQEDSSDGGASTKVNLIIFGLVVASCLIIVIVLCNIRCIRERFKKKVAAAWACHKREKLTGAQDKTRAAPAGMTRNIYAQPFAVNVSDSGQVVRTAVPRPPSAPPPSQQQQQQQQQQQGRSQVPEKVYDFSKYKELKPRIYNAVSVSKADQKTKVAPQTTTTATTCTTTTGASTTPETFSKRLTRESPSHDTVSESVPRKAFTLSSPPENVTPKKSLSIASPNRPSPDAWTPPPGFVLFNNSPSSAESTVSTRALLHPNRADKGQRETPVKARLAPRTLVFVDHDSQRSHHVEETSNSHLSMGSFVDEDLSDDDDFDDMSVIDFDEDDHLVTDLKESRPVSTSERPTPDASTSTSEGLALSDDDVASYAFGSQGCPAGCLCAEKCTPSPGRLAVALYDFESRYDDEISLKRGAQVTVLAQDPGTAWWKGRSGGRGGLFPGTHVLIVSQTSE